MIENCVIFIFKKLHDINCTLSRLSFIAHSQVYRNSFLLLITRNKNCDKRFKICFHMYFQRISQPNLLNCILIVEKIIFEIIQCHPICRTELYDYKMPFTQESLLIEFLYYITLFAHCQVYQKLSFKSFAQSNAFLS